MEREAKGWEPGPTVTAEMETLVGTANAREIFFPAYAIGSAEGVLASGEKIDIRVDVEMHGGVTVEVTGDDGTRGSYLVDAFGPIMRAVVEAMESEASDGDVEPEDEEKLGTLIDEAHEAADEARRRTEVALGFAKSLAQLEETERAETSARRLDRALIGVRKTADTLLDLSLRWPERAGERDT